MQATKDMLIQQVIELDEGTADILMSAGMHCLGCAMAHGETIEQACAVHGIDPETLIGNINQYLAGK
ncbi:MAG TPA: disulfide oxidoreductase [Clostridiales bacterium]|jgi:hybrid cluster-associated redox disulfide protein|nr:disulfide oxidoreductase [Clostridiales bacterium]